MRIVDSLVVPLGAYIAITLLLPAAHGAAGRTDFWHHAAVVLVACAIVGIGHLVLRVWRRS